MTKDTQKKLRKALLTLCCAALLVCITIGATVAYLTSTDEVVNTFTVGNVKITIDEAPVDENGAETTGTRVKANSYHLLPAHKYDKDPTIHVDEKSEDCWLFVEIDNGIAAIEAADNKIAAQMETNGWTLVAGETNIYAHADVASAGDNVVVFETFKIASNADVSGYVTEMTNGVVNEDAVNLIRIKAYAVQKDGFTTAADAWTAAKSEIIK